MPVEPVMIGRMGMAYNSMLKLLKGNHAWSPNLGGRAKVPVFDFPIWPISNHKEKTLAYVSGEHLVAKNSKGQSEVASSSVQRILHCRFVLAVLFVVL
jgi:hypothetical protein